MKHTVTSLVNGGKLEPWKGKALVNIINSLKANSSKSPWTNIIQKSAISRIGFCMGFSADLLKKRREAGEVLTAEQNREDFKERFGVTQAKRKDNGEWTYEPFSVSEWTTKQTEDAMEECRGHYAQWFDLPVPDENYSTNKGESK